MEIVQRELRDTGVIVPASNEVENHIRDWGTERLLPNNLARTGRRAIVGEG
jgi:hypothetical protein